MRVFVRECECVWSRWAIMQRLAVKLRAVLWCTAAVILLITITATAISGAGGIQHSGMASYSSCVEPQVDDSASLRDIVSRKYATGSVYIGATTGWSKLKSGNGRILASEFGYVTPWFLRFLSS